MIDSIIHDVNINLEDKTHLHPQKPKFNGTFNWQAGSCRTFFVPTARRFIKTGQIDPITGKEQFLIRLVGYAFNIQYVWKDNRWMLIVTIENRNPGYKRRHWERWDKIEG